MFSFLVVDYMQGVRELYQQNKGHHNADKTDNFWTVEIHLFSEKYMVSHSNSKLNSNLCS